MPDGGDGTVRFDGRGRSLLLAAYDDQHDVFVLWDAPLHERFTNGGNIQVHRRTIETARSEGRASQTRRLTSSGQVETVLACRSAELVHVLKERLS